MIRLTCIKGDVIYLNPDCIIKICSVERNLAIVGSRDKTIVVSSEMIQMTNVYYEVEETVEDILWWIRKERKNK